MLVKLSTYIQLNGLMCVPVQLPLILCNPMDCIACQAPLSVEFSRQNTGVGCHSLPQGIFPTQPSNPGLLHGRQFVYHLSHQGGHKKWTKVVTNYNHNDENTDSGIRCYTQRRLPVPRASNWAKFLTLHGLGFLACK